ncbi:hypothetical protein [Streptomyces sp. CBMA123]|uniref:hypothetical protein n=1 Tax=Streptomyces sp. CBMA123 TaxID=1896313 RepID=UPI001661B11B|nr:hypothetical protein [Streptomyces sp. CBMA123]
MLGRRTCPLALPTARVAVVGPSYRLADGTARLVSARLVSARGRGLPAGAAA